MLRLWQDERRGTPPVWRFSGSSQRCPPVAYPSIQSAFAALNGGGRLPPEIAELDVLFSMVQFEMISTERAQEMLDLHLDTAKPR